MSSTDKQEAAQAFFCAVVDFLGAKQAKEKLTTINTYNDFVKFWIKHEQSGKPSLQELFSQHVRSGKSSFANIESVLKDNAWYKSSRNIALKLIEEVQKNSTLAPFKNIAKIGWQNIFYAHQDTQIMDQVSKLFKLVSTNHKNPKNKNWAAPFSDINKWSPADIYFATNEGAKQLVTAQRDAVKKMWSYEKLNTFLYKLWKSGDLLPVSLKKAGDTVSVKYINFEKTWDARLKEYQPQDLEIVQPKPKASGNDDDEGERRVRTVFAIGGGARYSLEFATKCSFPVRKAATNAGLSGLETKIKIELIPIGGKAKEGQAGPEAIYEIPGLSEALKTIIENADAQRKEFKKGNQAVQKLITERTEQVQRSLHVGDDAPESSLNLKYSVTTDGKTSKVLTEAGKTETNDFQKELAAVAARSFEGTLLTGVRKHFANVDNSNDIRLLFMYAAARSENAAKYIIAK